MALATRCLAIVHGSPVLLSEGSRLGSPDPGSVPLHGRGAGVNLRDPVADERLPHIRVTPYPT